MIEFVLYSGKCVFQQLNVLCGDAFIASRKSLRLLVRLFAGELRGLTDCVFVLYVEARHIY